MDRRPAVGAPPGWSRVLGRPEIFKPYARLLNCDAGGLADLTVPKRAAADLYKELDRTKRPLIYHWERDGDTVTAGELLRESADFTPRNQSPPRT
jgi:hypothetical protein